MNRTWYVREDDSLVKCGHRHATEEAARRCSFPGRIMCVQPQPGGGVVCWPAEPVATPPTSGYVH